MLFAISITLFSGLIGKLFAGNQGAMAAIMVVGLVMFGGMHLTGLISF